MEDNQDCTLVVGAFLGVDSLEWAAAFLVEGNWAALVGSMAAVEGILEEDNKLVAAAVAAIELDLDRRFAGMAVLAIALGLDHMAVASVAESPQLFEYALVELDDDRHLHSTSCKGSNIQSTLACCKGSRPNHLKTGKMRNRNRDSRFL